MDNLNFDRTIRQNELGLLEFAFGDSLAGGFPGLTAADPETATRRGWFTSFDARVYVGSSTTATTGWLQNDGQYIVVGAMVYGFMSFRKNGTFSGTGQLHFGVPVPPYVGANTQSGFPVNGVAHGYDVSTTTPESFGVGGNVATTSIGATMSLYRSTGAAVEHNVPWAWTTDDMIGITFAYRTQS